MENEQISVTITYRKEGTQPPLYIAGSFSEPPWNPQEMDHHIDESGERVFEKVIAAKKGSTLQYKFRLGPGDWWILDEDMPTGKHQRGTSCTEC